VKTLKNSTRKLWLLALLALACPSMLLAQATAPDASDIVTTATDTFNLVGALVVAVVGFFIIVKIVKWIRK